MTSIGKSLPDFLAYFIGRNVESIGVDTESRKSEYAIREHTEPTDQG
jgi:hypothetical protein